MHACVCLFVRCLDRVSCGRLPMRYARIEVECGLGTGTGERSRSADQVSRELKRHIY